MLVNFESFEQQDSADLEYGGQLPTCKKLSAEPTRFTDHSITKEWTPDED